MSMTEDKKVETPNLDAGTPVSDLENKISEKLSEQEAKGAGTQEKEQAPKAKEAQPIDINALTPEQIQLLQEKLAATPRRRTVEEKKQTATLRSIDGKLVIAWKAAKEKKVYNEVEERAEMKLMIPVLFYGEDDYVEVDYKDEFMQAVRVTVEIIDLDKEEKPRPTGQTTYARDAEGEYTTHEVEMYVTDVFIKATVKTPDGAEIELDAKYLNS